MPATDSHRHINKPIVLIALLLATLLDACREQTPEIPPPLRQDTVASTSTADVPTDSTAIGFDSLPSAVTGVPSNQLTVQSRAEVMRETGHFITVIDSGDQQTFWQMLAQRSRLFADRDKLASKDEIWRGARETLGNIDARRITVIGGTRDSAALLVEGLRLIDSERVDDPVVIHLLREDGRWKVMYPGLLYPKHYLRR